MLWWMREGVLRASVLMRDLPFPWDVEIDDFAFVVLHFGGVLLETEVRER